MRPLAGVANETALTKVIKRKAAYCFNVPRTSVPNMKGRGTKKGKNLIYTGLSVGLIGKAKGKLFHNFFFVLPLPFLSRTLRARLQ